ncbi:GntR family transcriptional regulator [Micromonospora pisi]|nr:GntR family transcriptional regulator [Micromonospora pisi]
MDGVRPARRTTLADDVYESVRTLVMDHAVAPGERINIDALARQLEVSPTPVREALARLESDGLVRKRALAGYTATPLLTRAEFDELVEMRLILEPLAAVRATRRIADETPAGNERASTDEGAPAHPLDRLRSAADLPGPAPGSEGFAAIAEFTNTDARFHHLIAEHAGNRLLYDAIVRLRSHLHLFRLYFPTTHHGISGEEHHRVVDAMAAGDADAAGDAMRAHLLSARDRHLPFFAQT